MLKTSDKQLDLFQPNDQQKHSNFTPAPQGNAHDPEAIASILARIMPQIILKERKIYRVEMAHV